MGAGGEASNRVSAVVEAFAGESKVNRMYLASAQTAEEKGFPQVAKLFRAVAEALGIHALMHLSVLKGARSTADNLRHSIEEESYEHTSTYPGVIDLAKKDGDINAPRSFTLASDMEKVHERLYLFVTPSVGAVRGIPGKRLYPCPACGNNEEEVPNRCPGCGAPGPYFMEVL